MTKKLSASQAAKMVGKSVPTITRAIKKGKLSAEPNPEGGWFIDPSELSRVWNVTPVNSNASPIKLGEETPNETHLLQAKLEAQSELMTELRAQIDDLKQDRDEWRKQAQQLALAPPQEATGAPRRGLFSFFRVEGAAKA